MKKSHLLLALALILPLAACGKSPRDEAMAACQANPQAAIGPQSVTKETCGCYLDKAVSGFSADKVDTVYKYIVARAKDPQVAFKDMSVDDMQTYVGNTMLAITSCAAR